MSVRDGLENAEVDIPGRDAPSELSLVEGPADRPQHLSLDESRSRGEAYAELRQRAEGDWEPRPFEAPRSELGRFDPERAGLPPVSLDAADNYVAQHRTARPWLTIADSASPEARRIIAALDAGGGHGHIRHEGWVTEEASMRRAAYREDPAQLDPDRRSLGIDGLGANDRPHRCRTTSTRITDPDAFATAFARAAEHPKVREALDMEFDPDGKPGEVTVPIADLLGPGGHRYCTGWRLEPGDGSMKDAQTNRNAWLVARAEGRNTNVPEPQARPVPTFEGGVITFLFARNVAEQRYEIVTMFPVQRRATDDQSGLTEGDR
jgi:hypothetical protein